MKRNISRGGYVVLDWEAVQQEVGVLSDAEVIRRTKVSSHTIQKARSGVRVYRTSAAKILNGLGLRKHQLYLSGSSKTVEKPHLGPRSKFRDWEIVGKPDGWHHTDNGLDFRVCKMENRLLGSVFGRGKCFDLESLSEEDYAEATKILKKHPRVCRALDGHPNICRLEDCGFQSEKFFWIVDKWEEGQSLHDFVCNSPPATATIARLALEIASGLQGLHSNQIIRRCLDPKNIWIKDHDGSALLLDFEVAKLLGEASSAPFGFNRSVFHAPELESGNYDFATDVFSWAQIVCFCLLGKNPPSVFSNSDLSLNRPMPKSIFSILQICRDPTPSFRKISFDTIIPRLEQWIESEAKNEVT